jgi:hypothetical protein
MPLIHSHCCQIPYLEGHCEEQIGRIIGKSRVKSIIKFGIVNKLKNVVIHLKIHGIAPIILNEEFEKSGY